MYESYVKSLSAKSKKDLILIPLIVGLIIFLTPTLLQLFLSSIFQVHLNQIGSFPGMLSMVITDCLALYVIAKISKIPYEALGINRKNWISQVLKGAFGGIIVLSIVVFLIWVFGGSVFVFDYRRIRVIPFIIGLLFFIFQGTWEEIIYRAYLMPHFSKVIGNGWSIVITSMLFTLGHSFNPNLQPLPVLNLFIASIVFSLIYYYTGSLLIVGLGHGLWNFSQGFIFGAEVSGNKIPYSIFYSLAVPGREIISGGSFGFEGGIVTSIVGVVMIIGFVLLIVRRKLYEVEE